MSWDVEILPHPIEATLIILLGAIFPKTRAGTIVGKLTAIAVPSEAFKELPIKFRRSIFT
jgi:hypothetical protein